MKKVYVIIFVIILSFGLSLSVSAKSGEIDSYKQEFDFSEITKNIDSSVIELLEEIGINEISYESIFSVTPQKIFDSLFNVFLGALKEPFTYFLYALGILSVMALFLNLSPSEEIVSLIGSSCVALMLAVPISALITRAFSVLEALSAFNLGFTGVFTATCSASGGVVGGSAYLGLNVFLNSFLSMLLSLISEPLISCVTTLGFLSCFDITLLSEKVSSLIKKGYVSLLGLLSTVFSGVSAIKTVLGNSADTVTIKGMKFLVGKSLPLVGGVVSESYQSIIASLSLIKNTVGVFGIITVAIIVLPIILELLLWCFSLSSISAIAEAFGVEKIQGLVGVFKDVAILLIATICFSGMLFIVTTGMMIIFK